MKSLREIIEGTKEFLRSFRTESIKSGRLEDLDYLKNLLKQLKVSEKSGYVSDEVVGDYSGRSPMERYLFNGQVEEQIQRLLNYSSNQSFADNRGRPYIKHVYFEHTKRRGKDSVSISFTWQEMGRMGVYSHYRLYLG